MIGGFALMLIAPIRSIFLADCTQVSMGNLAVAKCVFVGIGLAASSIFWKRGLNKIGINRTMIWILTGFALFPLLLFMTQYHIYWLYIAHLIYGIAQAGSHLIWHLSGTIFAQNKNSLPYTTVNVLMIGIRGAIGPFFGLVFCQTLGPIFTLILGSLIALSGSFYLIRKSVSQKNRPPIEDF